MAYITIVLNTQESINQLNDRFSADATRPTIATEQLSKILDLIRLGYYAGSTMQVTTRSTDPGVGTVGTGSKQTTITLV